MNREHALFLALVLLSGVFFYALLTYVSLPSTTWLFLMAVGAVAFAISHELAARMTQALTGPEQWAVEVNPITRFFIEHGLFGVWYLIGFSVVGVLAAVFFVFWGSAFAAAFLVVMASFSVWDMTLDFKAFRAAQREWAALHPTGFEPAS